MVPRGIRQAAIGEKKNMRHNGEFKHGVKCISENKGHLSRFWKWLPVVTVLAPCILGAQERSSDLRAMAKQTFGALPAQMASAQNPVTSEKVVLGKILFYEPRISADGAVSCAKCHPMALYAADALPKAIGNSCKTNPRNAPTVLNAAAQVSAHWIGNRTSVEDQAKQALIGPPSFGMPSYDSAMKVLKSIPGYAPLFRAAFPNDTQPITEQNFSLAVGAFERTLVTPGPFDAFVNGDADALTFGQKKGMRVFVSEGCGNCHNGPYFGGQVYKKFGLAGQYWNYTKSQSTDLGRFIVTGDENDKYVFKVPVLRNVAMTPPYFHDGSVGSLPEAVRVMAKVQLGKNFSQNQITDAVTFLNALTGTIPKQAMEVPVLPAKEEY
jgi:cytochrome c peroxidase